MQTSGMVTVEWLFDKYDKLVTAGALKPLRFGAIVYENEGHYKDILSAIMQGFTNSADSGRACKGGRDRAL